MKIHATRLCAAVLFATAASQASAADLRPAGVTKAAPAPVAIAYDWSGFYVGGHGGYGWSDFDHNFNSVGHYNLDSGDTFGFDGNGALLGGHIGYNWQAGAWVYGLEGALTKSWMKSGDVQSPFFPSSDVWHSDVEWIASITGRVGFAMNNWLVYGKGGWAWSRINDHVHDTADFVDQDRTANGWTLGIGLEYAMTPNWILGVEYNRYDFGSTIAARNTNFDGSAGSSGTDHDLDVKVDTVLARLTYKFR